jgi:hypothetical protein
MADQENARRALEIRLDAMAPAPAGGIQYENALFQPPTEQIYLRTKVEFNTPDGRTFGVGATTRVSGLFVVDCFAKAGGGTAAVGVMVEQVLAQFKSGLRLSFGGTTITMHTPQKQSGVSAENWYFIPVICPWTIRTTELAEA